MCNSVDEFKRLEQSKPYLAVALCEPGEAGRPAVLLNPSRELAFQDERLPYEPVIDSKTGCVPVM